MSSITITSENFKRFSKRLQKQNEDNGFNTTLTQTQEILAKTLGANSYFELKNLLDKEDNTHSKSQSDTALDITTRLFKTALGHSIPNYKEFNNTVKTLKTAFEFNKSVPVNSISGFLNDILDETYTVLSYDGTMKKLYQRHVSIDIDHALESLHINNEKLSWWNIVEALIPEYKNLAEIAQFHAQPHLPDLLLVLEHSTRINDLYRNSALETGENIIPYFKRVITETLHHIYNNEFDRSSNGWYNLISKH